MQVLYTHSDIMCTPVYRELYLYPYIYMHTHICMVIHMFAGSTNWKWLCAAVLSMLCSSLNNEQGITVMAACLAYDVFYCVQVFISYI